MGAIVKNASGAIFKIEQVDVDGTIFLRPSKKDCEFEKIHTKSRIEVFLQKYSITTSVHEMLELKGALFDEHPDTIELVSKSQIFLNMVALSNKNIPHICIKKSPDRAVVVTKPYKVGALVLVLAYPKALSLHEGSEVPLWLIRREGARQESQNVGFSIYQPKDYYPRLVVCDDDRQDGLEFVNRLARSRRDAIPLHRQHSRAPQRRCRRSILGSEGGGETGEAA